MNMNRVSAAVTSAVVAGFYGTAMAATINMTTVTSNWHDTIGGVNVIENTSFGRFDADAGDGFNQVRWGTPSAPSPTRGRSGLGFNGLAPINNISLDTEFKLGELKHYNWTLSSGTAASSSQLGLSAALEIDGLGVPGSPFTFNTALTVDETANTAPCTYPSTTPCADRITFQQVGSSDTFFIDGVEYTFEVIGFGSTPDDLESAFISQEGGDSSAFLWAKITAVEPVSEPASLALLAASLGMAGWFVRKSKAA